MVDVKQTIKFGTPLHRKILAALEQRYKASHEGSSKRAAKWKQAEEQFVAYRPGS